MLIRWHADRVMQDATVKLVAQRLVLLAFATVALCAQEVPLFLTLAMSRLEVTSARQDTTVLQAPSLNWDVQLAPITQITDKQDAVTVQLDTTVLT